MRPVPITDQVAARWHGLERRVFLGPNGNLLADGSTPDDAEPVEVLHGRQGRFPLFVQRWVLEGDEAEQLRAGAQVELVIFSNGLPPVSMLVIGSEDGA